MLNQRVWNDMLVPFNDMPDAARLWVYQMSRSLTTEEVLFVEQFTERFISNWQAHGNDLKGAFEIQYNQFLVVALDESYNQASGCSIDASVHLIQALEKELGVSFMTSGQVAFLMEERINLIPFNKLKEEVSRDALSPQTRVFDNTVKNLAEYRQKWLVPSEETWVNRYFK